MKYPTLVTSLYAMLTRLAFPGSWSGYRRKYSRSEKGKQAAHRYSRTEKFQRTQSRYLSTPKGKGSKNATTRAYQARKRKNTVGDRATIRAIYVRCQELREWFDVVVDHVVPLVRGGVHAASNLQIIYRSENTIKGDRIDYQPKVIFT